MVVALLALVIAVASSPIGAYAAKQLNGGKIKNRTIKGRKLIKSAITSTEIKTGAVRSTDLAANSVTSSAIKNANVVSADMGSGAAARNVFAGSVPVGTTVTGAWTFYDWVVDDAYNMWHTVSLPIPAATALDDAHVQFGAAANDGSTSSSLQGYIGNADEDLECSGNFNNPTAPSGKVCIYIDDLSDFNITSGDLGLTAHQLRLSQSTANRYGFSVEINPAASNFPIAVGGTWAYTG